MSSFLGYKHIKQLNFLWCAFFFYLNDNWIRVRHICLDAIMGMILQFPLLLLFWLDFKRHCHQRSCITFCFLSYLELEGVAALVIILAAQDVLVKVWKERTLEFHYINTVVFEFLFAETRLVWTFSRGVLFSMSAYCRLIFINAYSKIALCGVLHFETPGAFKSFIYPPHVTLLTKCVFSGRVFNTGGWLSVVGSRRNDGWGFV